MYKIPANTLFIGKTSVFMPECHSTNTLALELCQQPTPPADGSVIITENQTSGRGQRGNSWTTEPGMNLTFSVILRPSFLPITSQFYLNVFSALAISDYLVDRACKTVHIKWPNDIYADEKKIAGVLIENQVMGNQITHCVLGIGLNINQRAFSIESITSLTLATGLGYNLPSEFEHLLTFLESRYLQLRQTNMQTLMAEYLGRLYWLNEEHTFQTAPLGQFKGTISGVDSTGRLKINVNGHEKLFGVKDVSYVRSALKD